MTLASQAMDWYNNLLKYNIKTYSQLANLFLQYFRINIKDKTSITDLTRLQQFPDESINDFISQWRVILISMSYTLPQYEPVKLFNQSFLIPIASTLLMQKHKMFEYAISQVVVIKRVKIQDGEIKGKK